MPLFKKPHGRLEWDDVKQLLTDRAPENELLDYKDYLGYADFQKDRNKRVLRTICAMANTYGGDLVLGVGEDRYGRPKPMEDLAGLPAADVEKVMHSIGEQSWNIRPPVLGLSVERVDIAPGEAPLRKGAACLVVVRLPESDLTPHFVLGIGHFGRVGSHNKPFKDEPLSTERLLWLAERKEQHARLLRDILEFADELEPGGEFEGGLAWHKVWCAPRYPGHLLWPDADESTIEKLCPRIHEPNGHAVPRPFEHYFYGDVSRRALQHGWVWHGQENRPVHLLSVPLGMSDRGRRQNPYSLYLVDDRGAVVLKGITFPELTAARRGKSTESTGLIESDDVVFDWSGITARLVLVCHHAASLYRNYGYNGPVQFGVEVGVHPEHYLGRALLGTRVIEPYGCPPTWGKVSVIRSDWSGLASPKRKVTDTDSCLASELRDAVLHSKIHGRWVRAFGVAPSKDAVQHVVRAVVEHVVDEKA